MVKQSAQEPRDHSLQQKIRQYVIAARKLPTEKDPNPAVIQLRVFAPNPVRAQSRFWYQMKRVNKVRKINGEFIYCREIFEKNVTSVKNYGILIKYQSRTAYHNMYREFRDTTLNGAMSQLYSYMSGNHRADPDTVHVIRTTVVRAARDIKRPRIAQFLDASAKFPIIKTAPGPSESKYKAVFKQKRTTTFKH